MEFSVLNKQTVQCIMTQKEIADYGLDKKAIFQNDERTKEFFQRIMQRAQRETGFARQRGEVAVHASFLSDETLEITFLADQKTAPPGGEPDTADTAPDFKTAVFKSKNLSHLMAFSGNVPFSLHAGLYKYKGVYFMLADIRGFEPRRMAVLYNLADEYVDAVCHTEGIAAFLREHGVCMILENAVEVLGKL